MALITPYNNSYYLESPSPEFYSSLHPQKQTLPGDTQISGYRKSRLPCVSGFLTRLFPEGWQSTLPIFLTSQLIRVPGTYGCSVHIFGIVFNMTGKKRCLQFKKFSNPSELISN